MTPRDFCITHNVCPASSEWLCQQPDMPTAWAQCERSDWMIWALHRAGTLEHADWIRLAVVFTEHVLPVFECAIPDDTRPRQVINNAIAWLCSTIDTPPYTPIVVCTACDYTVESAAYAASVIGYALVYPASAAQACTAAANAACTAAGCTVGAQRTERKWQCDQIRRLIDNPWQ